MNQTPITDHDSMGQSDTHKQPLNIHNTLTVTSKHMSSGEIRPYNINVGLLGHIDSGKTSLAKALSTIASTAAFDKSYQSKERGITLDLGFSSFFVDKKKYVDKHPHLNDIPGDILQFTLVDCPGHASLVRTVIGGASIIDVMVLLVDVQKGVQTQTAEGLVIGEILTDNLLIALNKCDLIPAEKSRAHIEKIKTKVRKTLLQTKFHDAPLTAISANPESSHPEGVEDLVNQILSRIKPRIVENDQTESTVIAIDHCFAIKGQGTVMTATVLKGSLLLNDVIELPLLKIEKKIKSMQMFRKPVEKAEVGDRVGICVTQLNPKLLERGLAGHPGLLRPVYSVILSPKKVRFFKESIASGQKFHITVAHETVLGQVMFFSEDGEMEGEEKVGKGKEEEGEGEKENTSDGQAPEPFDFDKQYLYRQGLYDGSTSNMKAVIQFDLPIIIPENAVLIGSRLDFDINTPKCRIAFHGRASTLLFAAEDAKKLKIYKVKTKSGVIDRWVSPTTAIAMQLFNQEVDMNRFNGYKVTRISTGDVGRIIGSFGKGKNNKFKVEFKEAQGTEAKEEEKKEKKDFVEFMYKKFLFDPERHFVQ